MKKFDAARAEEIEYHEKFYQEVELFQPGTWLAKPVKVVIDSFEMLNNKKASVLDLGCGVGRNSIPLAQRLHDGNIVCVDLLETALSILQENAKKYEVEPFIVPVLADIEHYHIDSNAYNLIVACSCLEHASSERAFSDVVNRMKNGTREDGLNCILINTEVRQLDIEKNIEEDGVIELNMGTARAFELLHGLYHDWVVSTASYKPQEIREFKGGREIVFKSNWITFVARRQTSVMK